MGIIGGDFGLSELLYQKLSSLMGRLPKTTRKRIANFVSSTVIIFSIAGPVMTLPQVYKVHVGKEAAGLSAITFGSYLFLSVFWLTYGIFIKIAQSSSQMFSGLQ